MTRISDERLRELRRFAADNEEDQPVRADEPRPGLTCGELGRLALEVQASRAGMVVLSGENVTPEQVEMLRLAVRELQPLRVLSPGPLRHERITDQELAWIAMALTWHRPAEQETSGAPLPDPLGYTLADKVIDLRCAHDEAEERIAAARAALDRLWSEVDADCTRSIDVREVVDRIGRDLGGAR